jgi:hypothetical protein
MFRDLFQYGNEKGSKKGAIAPFFCNKVSPFGQAWQEGKPA